MPSLQRIIILVALLLSTQRPVLGFSPQHSQNNKSFSSSSSTSSTTSSSSSALYYVRGDPSSPPPAVQKAKVEIQRKLIVTKPKVREIKSLDELQYFLEEDARLVAIKFYAPWCKTCKRLGLHFDRLALELGDTIQNRQKVEGSVRFATIEYGSETSRFITQTLQIHGVPTLQLYSGVKKLWQENGATTVRGLKEQLNLLESMSTEERQAHAEEVDDGILASAIEENFFDGPDFLNEEW